MGRDVEGVSRDGRGNLVLILVIVVLLPTFEGSINLTNVIFFTLLFTVVETMWDHYRQVHWRLFS